MVHEAELLHSQSTGHRAAIERSTICGCFDSPAVGRGAAGQTALCPRCGVDAVLPERNRVYPMGVALLRFMHRRWFGEGVGRDAT